MPFYQYKGRNLQGDEVSGKIESPTLEIAAESLMNNGIILLSVIEGKEDGGSSLNIDLSDLRNPTVPLETLSIFCRQLFSLIKAGVPLLRAIKGLANNSINKQLKEALDDVSNELSSGRTLSIALKKHESIFNSLFVSMIAVGENTGRLDEVLYQLAQYFEAEVETRKRIKEAMRYPIMVITFISIAMTILNVFVIPKFTSLFAQFDAELPLPTRILMFTSDLFINYWMYMLLAIGVLVLGFRYWVNTEAGRERWDYFRLNMPIVGDVVTRTQLARFSRTFSIMLRSGVALNQSLALAAEALGNKYLENRLLAMKSGIEAGSTVASTAINARIFTPLVIQMMTVGEETGQIDTLLEEVADFYEREVDYDLKTITARIEPILLLVVAAMVLILALGIFLPMWNMLNLIK